MPGLDDLLRQMMQRGASDLHLTSGSASYLGIHGDMVKLQDLIQKSLISKEDGSSFIRRRSAGKQFSETASHGMRLANGPAS